MKVRTESKRWRNKKLPVKEEQPQSRINELSEALKFIGGITAFVSVAGFMVVQSHLQLYTNLMPYNVQPTVYLTAGTVFLIFFSLFILLQIWLFLLIYEKLSLYLEENLAFGVALTPQTLSFLILTILTFCLQGTAFLYAAIGMLILFLLMLLIHLGFRANQQKQIPLWRILFDNLWVFLSTISLIIACSFLYGVSIYNKFMLGGGKPRVVSLVGKENSKSLANMGLTMINETNTASLCQIIELSDAALFFDPVTNRSVIVKDSEFIAKKEGDANLDCRGSLK